MSTPTTWTPQVKSASDWSLTNRQATQWAADSKELTSYTPTSKTSAVWEAAARNTTPWSLGDKLTASWTAASLLTAEWTVNDTRLAIAWLQTEKIPALYTEIDRTLDYWLNGVELEPAYLYDSASMTYDDSVATYDYVTEQPANQLNLLNLTEWNNN